MRKAALLAAALVTLTAMTQAPGGGTIEARSIDRISPNGDPNQIVCVIERAPGSPLTRNRVCRTRAEWTEYRQQTRQVVERVQFLKTTH